jgi:hypothetical protein
MEVKGTIAKKQDIRREIIILTQKVLQSLLRVPLLTLWRLGETPTKAIIAMRERQ